MPSQDVNALQNIVRCNANAKNVLRTSSGASLVWSKRDTDDAVDADAHSLVRCLAWNMFLKRKTNSGTTRRLRIGSQLATGDGYILFCHNLD